MISHADKLNAVHIGVGANLGDPIQQIFDARRCLSSLQGIDLIGTASLFYSSPVGYSEQPFFVNTVFSVRTTLNPLQCLRALQDIESVMGRQRCADNQNAPRTLDLDILIFDGHSENTHELTIPHPRMMQRKFVLTPLLELLDRSDRWYTPVAKANALLAKESSQQLYKLSC